MNSSPLITLASIPIALAVAMILLLSSVCQANSGGSGNYSSSKRRRIDT